MVSFGDIVLAAGGVYTSKPRPVLVFQNSAVPTGESTIVIPFTSNASHDAFYRVAITPSKANGLDRPSWLEVDKVSAIRTAWLGRTIGHLDADTLHQASDAAIRLMSPE